jgi:hypothetical protein
VVMLPALSGCQVELQQDRNSAHVAGATCDYDSAKL